MPISAPIPPQQALTANRTILIRLPLQLAASAPYSESGSRHSTENRRPKTKLKSRPKSKPSPKPEQEPV
ncbi:hypothetical protein [Shewanella sp.]|uniref:hypothetical protein n=1 Tax=Shewanella sp. TaxID=50422 RepID=UPI00257D81DF|nr:hypothetical protein [Shewanella sp.]